MSTELYISPIFFAAVKEGDLEKVKQLLDKEAKPNTVDLGGFNPENPMAVDMATANPTVLMTAAGNGHAEVVKVLLAAGAEPNHQAKSSSGLSIFTNGCTALMMAANGGYAETVKLLLAGGANPNTKNEKGDTALNVATKTGKGGGLSYFRVITHSAVAKAEKENFPEVVRLLKDAMANGGSRQQSEEKRKPAENTVAENEKNAEILFRRAMQNVHPDRAPKHMQKMCKKLATELNAARKAGDYRKIREIAESVGVSLADGE